MHLRRAVELASGDLKSRFALIHELERQGEPEREAEALRLAGELARLQTRNVVVLLERARLAAKHNDAEALRDSVAQLGALRRPGRRRVATTSASWITRPRKICAWPACAWFSSAMC